MRNNCSGIFQDPWVTPNIGSLSHGVVLLYITLSSITGTEILHLQEMMAGYRSLLSITPGYLCLAFTT